MLRNYYAGGLSPNRAREPTTAIIDSLFWIIHLLGSSFVHHGDNVVYHVVFTGFFVRRSVASADVHPSEKHDSEKDSGDDGAGDGHGLHSYYLFLASWLIFNTIILLAHPFVNTSHTFFLCVYTFLTLLSPSLPLCPDALEVGDGVCEYFNKQIGLIY